MLDEPKFELSIGRAMKKNIIDYRSFKPHEVKEVEEWSWKKLKNEKWFVQLDCQTKEFKKWKMTKRKNRR